MTWLWLNVPLMVLFAAAVVGIPLWLVLRRPDFGPEPASRPGEVPARVGARDRSADPPRSGRVGHLSAPGSQMAPGNSNWRVPRGSPTGQGACRWRPVLVPLLACLVRPARCPDMKASRSVASNWR